MIVLGSLCKQAFHAQASAALRFVTGKSGHIEHMRLLPLFIVTSAVLFSGCSAGAGMQATPAAPIAENGSALESATSPVSAKEAAPDDVADAVDAPVSQSQDESIPTGAGGRFLRM
jgi:hypothetical protein